MKAKKEFSKSLLENSVDSVMAFDRDGNITTWNKCMEELKGVTRADALGKNLFDLFPDYHRNEEGEAVRRALRGKSALLQDYGIKIIIEVPTTAPAEYYANLSGDLINLLQEATDPERAVDYRLFYVLGLTWAMVADEKTFADTKSRMKPTPH